MIEGDEGMKWLQLQKEQETIHTQIRNHEKFSEQKMLIEGQIEHARQNIDDNTVALHKIRLKLDKLEGFSFMNMIRTWTGQLDELHAEKVDKAAVLELKINAAKKIHLDLLKDLEQVTQKLAQINRPQLQEALIHLKDKKKEYLQHHAPIKAQKLDQLVNEEILTKQLMKEINEAEEAGDKALSALGYAAASLHSAGSYSTWDTFLSGRLLATHLKHDALDQSEGYLHNAQIALQRFQNELLDVQKMNTQSLQVKTDGFVKFADYFFDDIFSAWSVHAKISTAREQVSRVQDDVHNTIRRLQEKHKNAHDYLTKLKNEQSEIFRS